MALITILQQPAEVQAAQSPVVFSVVTDDLTYTSSRFQYTCKLDYWQGDYSTTPSVTGSYFITKYPNQAGSGLFDISKIMNSTLQDNIVENTSSLMAYKATFNYLFFTGSIPSTTEPVTADIKLLYDGYNINPEGINVNWDTKGLYPLLIDGPATQSVLLSDSGSVSIDALTPRTVAYVGSNGSTANLTFTGGQNTKNRLKRVPIGPKETGFPLSTTGLEYFTISVAGKSIRFDVICESKYTPVRIGYKNRYGTFNFMNFTKVSRESFATTQRVYKPSQGVWNQSVFAVDTYAASTQKYIIDDQQTLSVESDFLKEEYNDILKQLMTSDEVYWFKGDDIVPVSISSNNITFKKHVNEKLIQYSFTFTIGRNFKQLI